MRVSKLALGLGVALATVTAANAATWTLDYRHEYRSEFGENYDRLAVIGAFENGLSFYVDTSYKSWGSDGPNKGDNGYSKGQWGDFTSNAVESNINYAYKFEGTGITLSTGVVVESTSSATAYKPYVRLQYNTDFGLWFAIRPRFDYLRDDSVNYDAKTGRIDLWLGYNKGSFGINYNYTYMKALNDDAGPGENPGDPNKKRYLYDGKDHNFEHNIAMNYRMGQWNPYIEIGNMAAPGTSEKSGRQTRVRVGIQYTF